MDHSTDLQVDFCILCFEIAKFLRFPAGISEICGVRRN